MSSYLSCSRLYASKYTNTCIQQAAAAQADESAAAAPWLLDAAALTVCDELQRDAAGRVCRAYLDGDELLLRQLHGLSADDRARVEHAVERLARLYHPHLVTVRGMCVRDGDMCVATDFQPQGNLRDILQVCVSLVMCCLSTFTIVCA